MAKGISAFRLITIFCVVIPLMRVRSVPAQSNPSLQITNTNGSATISWPAQSGLSFFLQSTTNLLWSNSWVDSTVPTTVVGDRTMANLSMTNAQQFFRLKLPLFSFGLGVPVFQSAIFYNLDLEISPDQPMTINGKVFCNGNIWASPDATLTFQTYVDCTKLFQRTRNPNDPLPPGGGPVVFGVLGSPFMNVAPSLGMLGYFPAVNGAILTINDRYGISQTIIAGEILDPPPPGEDPNTFGDMRYYNFADLIVSNSSTGVLTTFFQDTNNVARLTPIPYDKTTVSTQTMVHGSITNYIYTTNYSYSFVTNTTFYDYREAKTVRAVQMDVGNLVAWITNNATNGGSSYYFKNLSDKGHGIDTVYVYSGVPLTSTQLPAVRLVNGQQLQPFGLTIAPPIPLYVLGNYNVQTPGGSSLGANNTAYTYPAAFIADAVTILSSNWSDSYNGNTNLVHRPAFDATVNAAILQGIVPSATVGGVKHYSGGAENFFRLLEDWSSNTLTYNGSMVAMFNCRYATNYWQSPGNYFNEPAWQWSFDMNFLTTNKLPPGTPNVSP